MTQWRGFGAAVDLMTADPLTWLTFSAWQRAFLADDSAWRVVRAANQIGKTTVIVADMLHEIRGTNPYRSRRFQGPVNVILVSESLEQMYQPGGIVEKLWELIAPGEVDPRVSFTSGHGLRGTKIPTIRFVDGPGAGSVISLRTYRQDPQTLAGATIHHVYCDEPMPERVYGELSPRLLKHNGTMTISFTPTLSMPDQSWLRKLVETGAMAQHHAEMTPENAHPEGYARPFLTQDRIDEAMRRWPEPEHALRFRAAWETIVRDRWLTAFSDAAVKPLSLADLDPDAWLQVGIDHGLLVNKQWSVLVAVGARHTDRPRLWFLAESGGKEIGGPAQDARDTLAMLAGRGLKYEHVDDWVGDRDTGDGRHLKSKSNAEFRVHLMAAAGIRGRDPRAKLVHTPTKWAGSVWHGLGMINAAFAEGRAWVDPSCKNLIQSFQKFKGDSRDPHKDVLDAARYAVERATGARPAAPVRGVVGGSR